MLSTKMITPVQIFWLQPSLSNHTSFSCSQASFFIFVSHFYCIAATGYAAQQRLSVPAILAMYAEPLMDKDDEPEGVIQE